MGQTSRDYRKLQVWQKAHELVLAVYQLTKLFPKEELFGLTSQMRRAAVSVPANIAEGCGRGSERELARFMSIAHGSASELSYFFTLAEDLQLASKERADSLSQHAEEVKRMLAAYSAKLKG